MVQAFWRFLEALGYNVTNIRQGSREYLLEELGSLESDDETPAFAPRCSKTARVVKKEGNQFLISAHGSSGERGFWGPTGDLLDHLKAQKKPWVMVLLHGSASAGYWLEPADVERLIGNRWKQSQASYKINEPQDVPNCRRFVSERELVNCLNDFASRHISAGEWTSPDGRG